MIETLNNNIIAKAEFRHQRYVIENSRSAPMWIVLAVLMLAPGALMSLVLFVTTLLNVDPSLFFNFDGSLRSTLIQIGLVALITMNIALYLVVTLVTVALSSNSIVRERTNRTWDVLLLTHVDARQLVLGKWWASVQALWGDHVMVFIMRLGIIGWVVTMTRYYTPLPDDGPISPYITHTLLLTLIVAAFSVIDAMFSAALGVAIPLSNLPGSVTSALVMGTRVVMIVLAAIYFNALRELLMTNDTYLVLGVIGLVFFALITWAALRAAQHTAIQGQVSSPQEHQPA